MASPSDGPALCAVAFRPLNFGFIRTHGNNLLAFEPLHLTASALLKLELATCQLQLFPKVEGPQFNLE